MIEIDSVTFCEYDSIRGTLNVCTSGYMNANKKVFIKGSAYRKSKVWIAEL